MRWCRFRRDPDGAASFGLVEDGGVHPVDGTPFDHYRRTREWLPLTSVQLLPPVIPPTFFCAGLNYAAHVRRSNKEMPRRPDVGYRATGALVGHGEPVVRPADYPERLVTEGELVAVIGRAVRRCSRDEAADAVLGWCVGNDVSARAWQRTDRTLWRAKNSDTFKPMGPWIDTDADPMSARTVITVNDAPAAAFATGDMIFDPFDFISEISRYITLRPGDVLWLGTDETVEMAPGDTVAVEITGVGTLSNPVVQEEPQEEPRTAAVEEAPRTAAEEEVR